MVSLIEILMLNTLYFFVSLKLVLVQRIQVNYALYLAGIRC